MIFFMISETICYFVIVSKIKVSKFLVSKIITVGAFFESSTER